MFSIKAYEYMTRGKLSSHTSTMYDKAAESQGKAWYRTRVPYLMTSLNMNERAPRQASVVLHYCRNLNWPDNICRDILFQFPLIRFICNNGMIVNTNSPVILVYE